MVISSFPKNFIWGAATASYQIEGAYDIDGRGLSIWDQFSHTPGKVFNNETGDIACDHYHRWPEDIQLMQKLGLDAYRFSIAWPRIFPQGSGQINAAGLDFYDRLVDGLLGANITPFITLYHWDLPLTLHEQGGWSQRDIVEHFARYTEAVATRLGDRVKSWMTLNEPAIFTWLGYLSGIHAPGFQNPRIALQVAHHVLLAHGAAVEVLRSTVKNAQVGLALSVAHIEPANESEEAQQATVLHDAQWNRWFIEPIVHGRYPQELWSILGNYAPEIEADDLKRIQTPLDFIGLNYYMRNLVLSHRGDNPLSTEVAPWPTDGEFTGFPWEVYPEGLYHLLTRFQRDFPVPAYYITENGAAYPDEVAADGHVHDSQRQSYLERHFAAAQRALAEGVPLKGYFPWSLMDNFEWAEGYKQRFGLIYVDYTNQRRILKDSAFWYQDVIRQQR